MVEEQQEPATGLDHTRDLGDRAGVVVDVLEHQTHDHGVEGPVAEGK